MMKLLIVDDEVNLVRNFADYLSSFPGEFEIRGATSGEEGAELLKIAPADVLLTDLRLPGIDGIELVRQAMELCPKIKVIVMTAFGSLEVRSMAMGAGALRFLDKPVDLVELRKTLLETAEVGEGWSGVVGGLDIFDLTQLLALSRKTKVIQVKFGKNTGVLVFDNGHLLHASTKKQSGEEAFFQMADWEGGNFEEMAPAQAGAFATNLSMATTQLMMEAARLRDERAQAAEEEKRRIRNAKSDAAGIPKPNADTPPPAEDLGGVRTQLTEGLKMAIKDHLDDLSSVNGFKGAAVFTPQGEMLEGIATGKLDIKNAGVFANNALLNAQKATDQMGVGRGNMMQIRAPQAIIVMRCLNEATDFAVTAPGKAHFHTVVILDTDGNTGMAGMILDKIVAKIADEVR